MPATLTYTIHTGTVGQPRKVRNTFANIDEARERVARVIQLLHDRRAKGQGLDVRVNNFHITNLP